MRKDCPRWHQYHNHFLNTLQANMNSLESLDKGGCLLQYRISAAKNDLTNITGATSDRLGSLSRAQPRQPTELPAATASRNETPVTNAGLSANKHLHTPCETFASPRGYRGTDQMHRDGSDEDNSTERTVLIQSDAIVSSVSYGATQEEELEDGEQGAQDRKKGAYLPKFAHPLGFFKSELSSKVRRPIVSMAMWARDLYLRIVVLIARGVRTITWPISHLL